MSVLRPSIHVHCARPRPYPRTRPDRAGRLALCFLAALPIALQAAPPRGSGEEEARAIALLDTARAATGGGHWATVHAIRYHAEVASGALRGSAETVEDSVTGRYVDRYLMGAVRGGQGYDGVVAWTADVTGRRVSTDAADEAESNANEIYRRSLSYWFRGRHAGELRHLGRVRDAGRRFDRISITPAGGRTFEMWIDARSLRIARLVDTDSGPRRVTELSDYRWVGNVALPFAARSRVVDSQLETRVTFTSIEIDPPLGADAFARPDSLP